MPPFGAPVSRAQAEAEARVAQAGGSNLLRNILGLDSLSEIDIGPPKISGEFSFKPTGPAKDAQYIRVSEALKDPKRWKLPEGGGEEAYNKLMSYYGEAVDTGALDPRKVVLVDDYYENVVGIPKDKPLQPDPLDYAVTSAAQALGIGAGSEHFDPATEFADDPVMRRLYKGAGIAGGTAGMLTGAGAATAAIPQLSSRPLLNAMLRGGLGFGGYGAAVDAGGALTGDLPAGEYLRGIARNVAVGAALPAGHSLLGRLAPALAETPIGRYATDAATFGGLAKLSGGSDEDVLLTGLIGAGVAGGMGRRIRRDQEIPTLRGAPPAEAPRALLPAPEPAKPRPRNRSRMRADYTGRKKGGLAEMMGVPAQEPIITPPPRPRGYLSQPEGGITGGARGGGGPPTRQPVGYLSQPEGGITSGARGGGGPPTRQPVGYLSQPEGGITSGARGGGGPPTRQPVGYLSQPEGGITSGARGGGGPPTRPPIDYLQQHPGEKPSKLVTTDKPKAAPTLFFQKAKGRKIEEKELDLPVAPIEAVPQDYVARVEKMSPEQVRAEVTEQMNVAGSARTMEGMSEPGSEEAVRYETEATVARAKIDLLNEKLPPPKDVFLGSGLGGAQGAYESAMRRPLDVEPPSPPDVPLAKGAFEYAKTGDINSLLPVLPASRMVGGVRQYGRMETGATSTGMPGVRSGRSKPRFVRAELPEAVLADIKAAPDLGSELPRHLRAIAARESFLSGEARTLQAAFGGRYSGAGLEYTQRTLEQIRHAQMARLDRQLDEVARNLIAKAPNIIKNQRLRELVPEIPMTSEDVKVPMAELLKRPAILEAVGPKRPGLKRGAAKFKDLSPAMRIEAIKAAKIFRIWFDRGLAEGRRLRRHQGRRGIGKIDSFWPYMQKVGAQEASGNLGRGVPDFLNIVEVESRHTKHRPETELAMRERDPLTMIARYAQSMNKDWAHTAAIGHLRPVIDAFKEADKPVSAAALQRLSDDFYGGKRHPLDRLSDGFASTTAGYYIRGFARMGSRGLMRQALGGNLKFNLGTQPSSALLVDARVDPRAATWAKGAMFDPRWRKLALETHAARVKQRTGGQVSRQDMGDLDAAKELFLSPGERVSRAILQGFTDFMEKNLNIYSALAGFKDGKQRGMSDREAWDYASTLVAEAQAMYNKADRPGMLNARDIGLIGRFMTFPTEMGNWARTMNLPGVRKIIGRTGAYNEMAPGAGKKFRILGSMMAIIFLQNLFHESFWGRGLWGLTSFVSFLNTFTPEAGTYNKGTFIAQFYWELAKGFEGIFKDEPDFGPMLKWAGNYWLPAGAQGKRTGGTVMALNTGYANIHGKRVRVSADSALEYLDTLLFGPYHFSEAREEIRRQEKEKERKGR